MCLLQSGKPFLGVCLGLQLLFEGSEESGGCEGLGLIPGQVCEFDRATLGLPVPHIGWNDMSQKAPSTLLSGVGDKRVYFVHSYRQACSQHHTPSGLEFDLGKLLPESKCCFATRAILCPGRPW